MTSTYPIRGDQEKVTVEARAVLTVRLKTIPTVK